MDLRPPFLFLYVDNTISTSNHIGSPIIRFEKDFWTSISDYELGLSISTIQQKYVFIQVRTMADECSMNTSISSHRFCYYFVHVAVFYTETNSSECQQCIQKVFVRRYVFLRGRPSGPITGDLRMNKNKIGYATDNSSSFRMM